MIGYLSPEGEFVECAPFEHSKLAEKLLKEQVKDISELTSEYDFENAIGNLGWCIFKTNYAGINSTKLPRPRFSNEQIKWISDNFDKIDKKQRYFISENLLQEHDYKQRNIPEELLNQKFYGLV